MIVNYLIEITKIWPKMISFLIRMSMFIQIFYLNTVKVNRQDRKINLIKDNLKALSARVGSFPSDVSGVKKLQWSKIQYPITS